MKKRVVSVLVLLSLLCTVLMQTSYAAVEPRDTKNYLSLSFDGTTACCGVLYRAEGTSDQLEVTLSLYQGSTLVDSWSGSGKGRVNLYGEHKVVSGKTYQLVATVTINGVEQPASSQTATCPYLRMWQVPMRHAQNVDTLAIYLLV